jgi:hypothetical protein
MHRINFNIWKVGNSVPFEQFIWNLMARDVLAVHYLYDRSYEINTVMITDKHETLKNDM